MLLGLGSLGLGCAPPSEAELAASRALDYLETTEDELGLDVVVAIQIYADRRDDARAAEVAERLRARLRPDDLARYGALLDVDKPAFAPGSLDGVAASATEPDPSDDLMDDRVVVCLDEAMTCEITDTCRGFVALEDRWGYVLTHQAVFLLFARWNGCEGSPDPEPRRHGFAANLVREMEVDPEPGDLAFERMAMIAHLGFAGAIEDRWIDALLDAQREEGCFEVAPGSGCHPHPTGLALWVLAHDIR